MKTILSTGTIVSHKSKYGMYRQSGIIIGPAGIKHGRKYFWVSYTQPKTGKVWQTAFWDGVLVVVKK